VLAITLAVGGAAACGGGHQAVVVRDATPSTPSSVAAPATTAPPVTPVVSTADRIPDESPTTVVVTPAAAAIEIHDAAVAGWHGVATVVGPGGPRSAPLDGGSVTFDGLDEGVYDVTVSRESEGVPPGDDGTAIGTSRQILDAGRYGLAPGDRAVVTCDETSCTGVL
jgi:hypothetical protein